MLLLERIKMDTGYDKKTGSCEAGLFLYDIQYS